MCLVTVQHLFQMPIMFLRCNEAVKVTANAATLEHNCCKIWGLLELPRGSLRPLRALEGLLGFLGCLLGAFLGLLETPQGLLDAFWDLQGALWGLLGAPRTS